ncbi:MAG: hypothetical protein N3I35_19060 [Clostridia bacterium]|nr:hypothetical protein [Clostridia bacterium]
MKKKIALTVACIVLGVMMLVTTAFAGATGNSGYEAYKDALRKSFESKSFSTRLDASIKDNGKVLAEASAIIKSNHETMSSVTSVKTNSQEKIMETYVQADKTVIRDGESDIYYVIEHKEHSKRHSDRDYENKYNYEDSKAGETIVDALVGNMKNYFSLNEKADGSKNVSFQLSGTQIPSVVNVLASVGIREASKENYRDSKHMTPFGKDFNFEDIELPKLVDDIRISSVDFDADINKDNIIDSQLTNITVQGKDASGVEHEVVLSINMDFSDFGITTPDVVDLTGKQVQNIDPEEFEREHRRD